MTKPYAELLAQSCFSFLQGASHPEELVETAYHLGYRALALIDENGFYGMVRGYHKARELDQQAHEFDQKAREFNESQCVPNRIPFKFLVGTQIQIEGARLSFIAKNFTGYKQLCRFISSGFENRPKGQPIFTRAHLERWISPDHIFSFILPRDLPSTDLMKWAIDRLAPTQLVSRYYHPDLDQPLKIWLENLPQNIPRAWTWDAQFHTPNRHELYEVLRAIRSNTALKDLRPTPNGERYLKDFSPQLKIPTPWIHRGLEIAEACEFSPSEIRYQYPREWLPSGKTSFEFLKELCDRGLQIRYHGRPTQEVLKQLAHELDLVRELNFEDYFLTVWDIVQFARSKNILCQGRGSAANSIVCYLLEITAIDPVHMNLLFERFISRERNEAPDIDVDFEHERREEVIQYLYQKYGRHRAGMVATLITYRTKSSLRDVGKALSIPAETIDLYTKRASWRENVFAELNESPPPSAPLIQRWLRLSRELKGMPRHLGQHTGGMVLTHDRLDEMSPIEPASMAERSVIQWDKYDIEKLGLLKVDVLSLGMLTCIRKAFELINARPSRAELEKLELHTIPADDPKTYEMIQKSRTVGVFQIESRAQMTMLPRLKPKNFYDLVIEVAIVRPGPIQGGMVHPFLKRRLGLEPVTYAHPKLKPILEKTLGVPIFQEQVMKMAIEVAGYSPGEADALRRAMGAWRRTGNLESHAKEIQLRLMQQGVAPEFSERICAQILGFGEYGFPESHAASFALLTYASAYLKAHYPAEFLCALLNSMPMGFYPMHVLTSSFQRENVIILPVHTEHSAWDHQLESISTSASANGPASANRHASASTSVALRLGFRCVRGLQKSHVDQFIQKRSEGILDLFTFDVNERAALAMATELEDRRKAYWQALNPHHNSLAISEESKAHFNALDPLQNMMLDFEFTSTTLAMHPALLLKKYRWNYECPRQSLTLAEQLPRQRSSQIVSVFGVVQIIQSPPTAKGMFFLTLEDETGFINLVFKPDVYEKFKSLIQTQWALLVRGRVQLYGNTYASLLVESVIAPNVSIRPKRITHQSELRRRYGFRAALPG